MQNCRISMAIAEKTTFRNRAQETAGRRRRARGINVERRTPWEERSGLRRRGGCGFCRSRAPGASLPAAADVEAVAVGAAAKEEDHIACVELLLLDEAAPALGEHVALAAGPVGVAEPPRLSGLVFEAQQKTLLPGLAVEREVLLRVLLRDHQPVQLPDVARRQRLLEHGLLVAAAHSFSLRRLGPVPEPVALAEGGLRGRVPEPSFRRGLVSGMICRHVEEEEEVEKGDRREEKSWD
ncbi:hypothetical protein AXF42_Ash009526 [Apostasia shenzhenica]|uniref:Uncharacterized protein n=1 Tax=Apostasia shenzhenica TaxID=1088818 RepID=A0A2I0B944_9ASPA|nr:hypothetical protein AXF42_Ash009526 [Apostasia shenzhenica]